MASIATFNKALEVIGKWEGDWSDHPLDPGGATKYGITIKTLSRWRKKPCTPEDVRNMPYSEAKEIYKAWYWDLVKADELPDALAFIVFDAAINQGVGKASKLLQLAYNSSVSKSQAIKIDGVLGPVTMGAVTSIPVETMLLNYAVARALHYHSLTDLMKTFGLGWFRRLFDIYKHSVLIAIPVKGN